MRYFIYSYVGKPLGNSGENCGTTYNLDEACPICGTGAQIKDKLVVQGFNKIKKDIFQTIDGDDIISENLYFKLAQANIIIGNLRRVIDLNIGELPFFHLTTLAYLPKASTIKGLIIENQCPYCKQNGYFNDAIIGTLEIPTKVLQVELIYMNMNLDLQGRDIINSWEHMGLSNKEQKDNLVIRYARPLLIMSERLKLFLENEVGGKFEFEAITIHY